MNAAMEKPRQAVRKAAELLFRGRSSSVSLAGAPEPGAHLAVDENGAPVTFEAARWLICFVPGLKSQFWHRFVHPTHKHVLLLKPNPDGGWTLFEPWWTRLLVRTISTDQAMRFLHWAAMGDALLVEEDVPGKGSQFRGWSNCVSLAAFVLGRSYCVWSPNALFRRLLAEDRTQHIDVADFVDRYVAEESERHGRELAESLRHDPAPALRDLLIDLGRAVLKTSTTPRQLGLYRAAVAEASRFPRMARTFHDRTEQNVRELLARCLALAGDRKAVGVEDCQGAAARLLSLLRGDLFTQVAVGLRPPPTDREIDATATAAADLFLSQARGLAATR